MSRLQPTATSVGRVTVGRLEVQYHAAGRGDPVLLVHGAGPGTTACSTFGPTIDVLARRFRVLAPDLPGWGESTSVEFDARVQLAALVGFMEATGTERAALVGHSLGGARALDLAAAHPDRVTRLVLLAAPAPVAAEPTEGGRAVVEAYLEPTPERMLGLLAALCYDQSLVTAERATELSEAARAHPEHGPNFLGGLAKTGGSIFAAANPSSAIAEIVAPTLIVHGQNDRVVAHEAAFWLHSAIADSRLLLLERCGHWPHVEYSSEADEAVASFLGESNI
jgi:2-hydroxy-6-oxonona-2,4-dienedioate hydrolase